MQKRMLSFNAVVSFAWQVNHKIDITWLSYWLL